MNWTINLAVSIVLSSITGSILFGVWYSIGKLMEIIGRINVMYDLLKVIVGFWYVPIAYVVLMNCNYEQWGGFLFRPTKRLTVFCTVLCIAWAVGMIFLLLRFVRGCVIQRRKYRESIQIGEDMYDCFLEVCKELGIKEGKVDLVFNYKALIPCIGGVFRCYVVLPSMEYSEEEQRVIYYHELTHYKQKNQLLKHLGFLLTVFHFFNPLVWVLQRKVTYWGEYACDDVVIPKVGGVDNYFDMIDQIADVPTGLDLLLSGIFEEKSQMEKRKALARRSFKMKKVSRFFAFILMFVMVATSTVSVKAATIATGENVYNTYFATVNSASDKLEVDKVEYTASGFEQGVVVKKERASLFSARAIKTYTWTIKANRAQSSYNFTAQAGQQISMSVVATPNTASYRMGIIQPDGTLRYINGSGAEGHDFVLTQSGTYAIYVQNMSNVDITVVAAYNVE